ncbi:hypothetical protein [Anaerosacchariphilus polymeriproducens]|uniref:Uncharacterized protein n=1 Tax=Anaerosacchariphilus polymeriproducens TaxID=1812858 RepID=A0A371AYC0_9FIRM|nr:hypothetical protein [Anaerosacchariphilus polymeriproducens]RDU24588.1 hypothetical protein DWV06_03740 [Anaerosacchariphilus polymeriproducens]
MYLYQVVGIFNAIVVEQTLAADEELSDFHIKLKGKEGDKMYSGNMLFQNEKDMEKYRAREGHIEELQKAEEIDFYTK